MARLSRQDWLEHGLRTLTTEGAAGLKADRMVKALGVSRGSFYWHFADLGDFHRALLEHWLETSVRGVVADIERASPASPTERLHALIATAADAGALERAVRSWGASAPDVQARIDAVDQQRIQIVEELMVAAGVAPSRAHGRAVAVYMSSIGCTYLAPRLDSASREAALAEIQRLATGP